MLLEHLSKFLPQMLRYDVLDRTLGFITVVIKQFTGTTSNDYMQGFVLKAFMKIKQQ